MGPELREDCTLIVDADSIVFSAGFAVEPALYQVKVGDKITEFRYKKEMQEFVAEQGLTGEEYQWRSVRKPEPLPNALHLANTQMRNICELPHGSLEVYLTGKDNFRYDIATIQPYKGNRVNVKRPYWEKEIRQFLVDNWGAVVVDGEEADDAVAISGTYNYPNCVIVSADKDLDNVPGWHRKMKNKDLYFVTPTAARLHFYKQLLTGDNADHIRGIPGVAEKTALKILGDTKSEHKLASKVLDAYYDYHVKQLQAADLPEEPEVIKKHVRREVTETGQLLWMRTEPEEMWQIPKKAGFSK